MKRADEELSVAVKTPAKTGKTDNLDCGCDDPKKIDLEKLRVLVVDDSQFTRRIVREGLSMAGVRYLFEANDAVKAIELLKS